MMNLELQSKLLRAKSFLNKLSDTSYGYANISKEYPFSKVSSDKEGKQLLEIYEQMIADIVAYVKNYEQGKRQSSA